METRSYRPTRVASGLRLALGAVLAAIGLLLCLGTTLAAALLTATGAVPPGQRARGLPLALLLLAVGAGCAGVGAILAFVLGGDRIELTPTTVRRITSGPVGVPLLGRRDTVLPLATIVRADVRSGRAFPEDVLTGVWIMRLETGDGRSLDIDLGGRGYNPLFDARAIVRDLLPRLPAAQIDPRLRVFADGGPLA
jgi:hypothetical protein